MENDICCQVCGDPEVAYPDVGAFTCLECRRFFTIISKEGELQCKNNQQCTITETTRGECKFCRFKKCLLVGLRTNPLAGGNPSIAHIFIDRMGENALIFSITKAYQDIYPLTEEAVFNVIYKARSRLTINQMHTSQVFCPLNLAPHLEDRKIDNYYNIYTKVIEFALRIPGFCLLSREDIFSLLLNGIFQALFVIMACLFNSQDELLSCFNGQFIRKNNVRVDRRAIFLENLFMTAWKINNLKLGNCEKAIFCSVILVNAETPELKDKDAVLSLETKLSCALLNLVHRLHPENPRMHDDLVEIMISLNALKEAHLAQDSWSEIESVTDQTEYGKIAGCENSSAADSPALSHRSSTAETTSISRRSSAADCPAIPSHSSRLSAAETTSISSPSSDADCPAIPRPSSAADGPAISRQSLNEILLLKALGHSFS